MLFEWDTSVERAQSLGGQTELGLVAHEVEAVLPQMVGENADGYKSPDYAKVTAFLIEVAKAQQAELRALRAQVDGLKAGLASDLRTGARGSEPLAGTGSR